MWTTAHLAIGYALGRRSSLDVRWCLLGSLVLDLIDKLLGQFGVLPAHQTVSHSLVGLPAVSVLVAYAASRASVAFSVAWVLHFLADVFQLASTAGRPRVRDAVLAGVTLGESPGNEPAADRADGDDAGLRADLQRRIHPRLRLDPIVPRRGGDLFVRRVAGGLAALIGASRPGVVGK